MNKKEKEDLFKKLVTENADKIKNICKYYSPDSASEDDLYQEILINIWNGMDRFRGDAQWSTWIYRVAVNTSLGFAGKSLKVQKLYAKRFPEEAYQNLPEEKEDKQWSENDFELLETELNQLSIIDKAIVTLSMENVKSKDIADIIGLTESNVRVKLHRIKQHLAHVLTSKS
ncbi:MAG: hypothetical protein C0599_06680 [Salinivirgaceae bacterium]|nr:MAG: hypothetical protein C0599_06680 [Salinivirgaceae bacterium]